MRKVDLRIFADILRHLRLLNATPSNHAERHSTTFPGTFCLKSRVYRSVSLFQWQPESVGIVKRTLHVSHSGISGTDHVFFQKNNRGLSLIVLLTTKYDFKAFADNGHFGFRRATYSLAFSSEEGLVCLPPVLQRPIAFAFRSCELFGYVIVGDDFDRLSLDDTQGRFGKVGDHA